MVEEKFKELDSDQIEGGEFEFWCLETRFERNKRLRFWKLILNFGMKIDFWIWSQNLKFGQSLVLCFDDNFAQNWSKIGLYTVIFDKNLIFCDRREQKIEKIYDFGTNFAIFDTIFTKWKFVDMSWEWEMKTTKGADWTGGRRQ